MLRMQKKPLLFVITFVIASVCLSFSGTAEAKKPLTPEQKKEVDKLKARILSFYERQIEELEYQEQRRQGIEAMRKERRSEDEKREQIRQRFVEVQRAKSQKDEEEAYQRYLKELEKEAEIRNQERKKYVRTREALDQTLVELKFSEEREYELESQDRKAKAPGN